MSVTSEQSPVAAAYDVRVVPAEVRAGEVYWQAVSLRHLTPEENQGRHHVYVDVQDEAGQRWRAAGLRLGWTWAGRGAQEPGEPAPLNGPDGEPAGQLDLQRGQPAEVWIQDDGVASDRVANLHTGHPDEPDDAGQLGNADGRHSFWLVFQRVVAGEGQPGSRIARAATPATPAFTFSAWPTEERRVTQWFGANPGYYAQYGLPGHEGIDVAARHGTRVFCVAPGRVKMVHPEPSGHNYGTHVRVLHEQGYETIYGHMLSVQVKEGQTVAAGQVLGLADHTGNAAGDHLHLTLKHAGETLRGYPNNMIDPTPFLAPLLAPPHDAADYVSDTVPDGSPYPAGTSFVETWRLKNTGNTRWGAGYQLALFGGDALGAPASVPLPAAAPGQEVAVSVTFTTPPLAGRCRSRWKCRNAAGAWFGDLLWVEVQVVAGAAPTQAVTARQKLGVDANAPIDAATGAISSQLADPGIMAGMGPGWVRLNFILGPWQSPLDGTRHNGLTWQQTYRKIVDGLRARGLRIYGLIGHEAVRAFPGRRFRDPPTGNPAADEWLRQYAAAFADITRLFHDAVDVFETFNEPDNWTRLAGEGANDPAWHRAWVHPEWFAAMLQAIWERVRAEPRTAGVRIVSGPLQGLDTGNGARDYLRRLYRAGKKRYGWGQVGGQAGKPSGVPFPFDGVGYHLYIAQNPPNPAKDVPAKYNQFTVELRQVIADEEGAGKPIFVSEMGWQSSIGEAKQAECLQAGLRCLLNDPGVALGIWFCTRDWTQSWGLYRPGPLSPANRKPAYATLKGLSGDPRPVTAAVWRAAPAATAKARAAGEDDSADILT